ncbi:MAG: hypothetical protein V1689_15630 [Pseudomonadota bacterium]
MIEYRESLVSAHHNYLVNGLLTPGFLLGNPASEEGFFFLGDVVHPGESRPLISARLLDKGRALLVELHRNKIRRNPGKCLYEAVPGGFLILQHSGEPVLEVRTMGYPNGWLTKIRAMLFDETGDLRMESAGEGIRIHGDARLVLSAPYGSV